MQTSTMKGFRPSSVYVQGSWAELGIEHMLASTSQGSRDQVSPRVISILKTSWRRILSMQLLARESDFADK